MTYSTEPSDNVTASVINGFTTIGVAPSIPTGLTTSSITATSAVISWNPATGSPPFTYYYQLGSNGVILQDNKNTNATSVTLTGLSPATEYSWCVLAKNSIGNSVYSNIITFTTSTAPILPGKILAIPNIHQKLNFWCWNAVCLQVLKWYRLGSINGYPINSANYENCQNEICKHAFYGSVGNYLNYLTPRPQLKGEPCSDIMQYFRQGTTVPLNFEPGDIHNPGNLSKDDVVKSIDADRPIFCAMGPTAGNQAGHILLIKGYMTVAGIRVNMWFIMILKRQMIKSFPP